MMSMYVLNQVLIYPLFAKKHYRVDHVITDPLPRDIAMMGQKRRSTWAHQTLQDAKGHVAPRPF